MADNGFYPYDQVSDLLEQVLDSSPADETELVWFERRHCRATCGDRRGGTAEKPRLTVLVRVVEGRRQGWHRTETADVNQLQSGVRQALALAKVQQRVKRRPVLPTDKRQPRFVHELLDERISSLEPGSAEELLGSWCAAGVRGRLRWSETHLAVWNSHGVRRSAATTELSFEAVAGDGPGAGRAAGSARTLAVLEPQEICRRAQRLAAGTPAAGAPLAELAAGSVPVLLAPEATAELLNVLNIFTFSGRAYLEGTSFLARHRNDQVFDRCFNLRDDGTRMPGVPFPFDLEGSLKRPVDLIVKGQPSSPALNVYQGALAGLRPTAQAVGGQDSFFGNLFLLPGEASEDELLAAADGGLWIGWLDPPECDEPTHLSVRARARGVRRIEGGRLGAPLPDLVWEETLLGALARLRLVGRESVVRSTPTTPMGAISAPAVVLTGSDGFRVA